MCGRGDTVDRGERAAPEFTGSTPVAGAVEKADAEIIVLDADRAIPWVEQRLSIEMAESQRSAVRLAVSSKLLVITGGPGVGKTTIVKGILRILSAKGVGLLLCAPTGRAAKGIGRVARDPTGAKVIATRIRRVEFHRGDPPSLRVEKNSLIVQYNPLRDIDGRPSSARVARFLEDSL